MQHHNRSQLLLNRHFLALLITQFLGAFNDNIFKSALVMLITFKLVNAVDHAQLLINIAGGIFILPFFLFSATAGQLADKFDRAKLVRLIKLFEIIFMLLAAVGFYFEQLPWLMLTLFLMGTHSTFFGPIKYSALPDLVLPAQLLSSNGLIEASTFIAILLGTILGTLFGGSTQGALLVSGIAICVAVMGFVSSLFMPALRCAEPALKINWNFVVETGRLITQIKKDPVIFKVILAISWFWLVGFIFVTQFPVYTKAVLQSNQEVVTLFLVMFSVGVAVGSLLCNRLLKGKSQLKYVSVGIWAMSLFILDFCWASYGIPLTPSVQLKGTADFLLTFSGMRITLDLFLLSACGGFYAVLLYAILQTESAETMRSRVIGCNNIFNAIFMVLAAGFTILLVKVGCSTVQIFSLIALANATVGIWIWRKMV